MCADRGFSLKWDLSTYLSFALYSAEGVRKQIYKEFPDLFRYEPCWDILYQEKKQAYAELLVKKGADLMPGVESLLKELEKAGIKRCVVTHSALEQVNLIRSQLPILDSIPHWITRENYQNPKPSSECYRHAISKLADQKDRIIGFEDSPRGLKALLGTSAQGVLVSSVLSSCEVEKLSNELEKKFLHIPSLEYAAVVSGL